MTSLGRAPRSRRLLATPLLLLALAACDAGGPAGAAPSPSPSTKPPPLQSVVVNAQVVAGLDQRIAIGIVNADGVPVPDVEVLVQLQTLPSPGQPARVVAGPEPAPYRGAGLQGKGVYVVHQTFAQPGLYTALVQASKNGVTTHTRSSFQVQPTDPTPAVGKPAPRTQNPTAAQADLRTLDTGVPPDDMHYTSVAAAIAAGHVTVVYFGAPGFCTSKLCAPEVQVLQGFEAAYHPRGVDFVHIETYRGGTPDNPDLTKATTNPYFDEWGLTTDPWVFVVDRQGNVAAKFDGPVEADEITPTLDRLLA
ncbi:MAG TPA: hypothetical protein VG245_04635 [Candidatus Dormibacteraeota bacterium]|nr:hypothetical protein [Candidatus Dormibacteraeota bacterium]